MIHYNVIGNDKRECVKSIMIGQSAAKISGDRNKVQRLVKVIFQAKAIPVHVKEEITSSAGQLVVCQVCNRNFRTITNTHLKRHGMNKVDYKTAYPDASLGKCEWFNERRNSKENKEHLQKQAVVVISSPELIEKRNHSSIATAKASYREKLSNSMKAYAQTPKGRERLTNKPVTSRMRMSNYDRWVEDCGYEIANQKQLAWQEKNKLPSKSSYTTIERLVNASLEFLGHEIITQFTVPHYYCDVYVPKYNLIIEVFGTHWHADPTKHIASDIIGRKGETAQWIWDHDAKKISDLKKLGYNVAILWEKEIKLAHKNNTLNQLIEDIVRSVGKPSE